MPVDEPSVAHIVDFHVKGFAKLKKNWIPHYQNLKEFDEEGVFSAFPGYEIHSGAMGTTRSFMNRWNRRTFTWLMILQPCWVF